MSGVISYFIVDNNPDGTASTLPPGLTIYTTTGELAGKVPYQAAVTTTYQFTMKAVNFTATVIHHHATRTNVATKTTLPCICLKSFLCFS